MFVVFSDVTLKDTSGNESGKITGTGTSYRVQLGSKTTEAILTVESGTIEAPAQYGVNIQPKGTLIMNGGTIRAKIGAVIDYGNFVMNGGHVVSETTYPTVYIDRHKDDTSTDIKHKLTVNGGVIEAQGNVAAINLVKYCSATINGGKIKALYSDLEQKKGGVGIGAFHDTEVTITGGTILAYSHALAGNGTPAGGVNEGENAKFTITGGTLSSSVAAGIYAPQVNGETTISGETTVIKGGRTGVEVRAGTLTITGGTITGNQEEYDFIVNKNGLTTNGAAVSVCQHTTLQPITVTISGGTFYGYVPLVQRHMEDESDPEHVVVYNEPEKINYDVSGGVFHSSGTETAKINDYVNGPFISGGKYTHYVTDYVKDGYGEKIENDPIRPESNMKAVYKWREVSWRQDVENGTTNVVRHKTTFDDGTTIETEPDGQEPIVDPEDSNILKLRTLKNDKIYIEPDPDTDCEVSSITVLGENGNGISVDENNVFLAPDADSTVTVIYTKTEHGETDHGESEGDEDEHGTIYGDSEDENSENNEQGENSFMNIGDLENLSTLLDLLLASTIIIIVI